MERCDFSSIISVMRSYVSDGSGLNQIDLLYALFASFMEDDASADFDLDAGLVCRWCNGQARISPRITAYYHSPKNQKLLAADIDNNLLPVLYDSVMAVRSVYELLVQDSGISEKEKKKLCKHYPCKDDQEESVFLAAILCFGMEFYLKRMISVMVGHGSVSHNSRKFHAKNTDPERSHLNKAYCNENIRDVYRELFDAALKRYNDKQTRTDRQIKDYYEKIRSGKQEKTFHEIILQIGSKDDMSADSKNGSLAASVLDEYMRGFGQRNPQLQVFSAHLHMDEATPHLHIDFVPFITGSKRGLETRVSLKQALARQGFKGGTHSDTEWNQWVQAEKQQLAAVMARHGIEWENKGTHEQHLSVLDYKKQERSKEVAALEEKLSNKKDEFENVAERIRNFDEGLAELGRPEASV